MKTIKISLFLLSAVLFTACTSTIMDDEYRFVDSKLSVYIVSFKEEARKRNVTIDDSRLKLSFGYTHGAAAVTDHSLNSIVVDSTTINWKKNPEEVIYHEFGHLFLHRGHDDSILTDTLGNEVPKSIMSTKASVKYSKNVSRRPYYLDELFNHKTPRPLWAN